MVVIDVNIITFVTTKWQYEFKVMTIGLTNAPATFQTLMNYVFKPFLCKFVLVFFDDILMYILNMDTHLQHLEKVFQTLANHQLYAKVSKCFVDRSNWIIWGIL